MNDVCSIARAQMPAGASINPDREHMISVPGGSVYVRINGNLSVAPPIVLIHGGPGSSHWYFLNATSLANERAVILYDQLDSGRSERPGDPANWNIERFVSELEAIRLALKIDSWHVLGTSWGAVIALEYAARMRRELASLIMSSPAISTELWLRDGDDLIAQMPQEARRILQAVRGGQTVPPDHFERANDAFEKAHVIRREPPLAVKNYRDALPLAFNEEVYSFMWGPAEYHATGLLKHYDGTPLLDRIDGSRTLFVTGQYDEARPSTVRSFANRARASFAEIPDAAHLIMNDNPDAYLAILRSWLQDHDD